MLLLHDLHLEALNFGLALDQIIAGLRLESIRAQLEAVRLLVAVALDFELSADGLAIIFDLLQDQSVALWQLRVYEDEILEQLLRLTRLRLS